MADAVDDARKEDKRNKLKKATEASAALAQKIKDGKMRKKEELELAMIDLEEGADPKAMQKKRKLEEKGPPPPPVDFEGQMALQDSAEEQLIADIPNLRILLQDVDRTTQELLQKRAGEAARTVPEEAPVQA